MNDEKLIQTAKQALNRGTAQVDARTALRLKAARERALAAMPSPERSARAVGQLAGGAGASVRLPGAGSGSRLWLGIAGALIGLALAVAFWQQLGDHRPADDESIDAQLLAGDLPIDAYTTENLQAWLQKSSR